MPPIPTLIQQGLELHISGKLVEAEKVYLDVLTHAPNEPSALHLLGVLRHQQNRHTEAAEFVRRAIVINPRQPDFYINLSSICRALNDADGAVAAGRRATELQPNSAGAWNNLALGLKLSKRYDDALQCLDRALKLQPNFPDALMNIGNTLCDCGRHEQAISWYQSALRLRPSAPVYYNLGLALHALKRDSEAASALEQATRLSPGSGEFFAMLGDAYVATLRFDDALGAYQRALTLAPGLTHGYIGMGICYRETNRMSEAIAAHRRAIHIQTDSAEAHYNLALSLLKSGEFEQGWRELEWRWRWKDFGSAPPRFTQPAWDGSIDPRGKRILIYAEQGLGDTLQFIRYAPLLASRGAQIIVQCQSPLVRLIQSVAGVTEVFAPGEALPEFDFHIAMMSLPLALGTTLSTLPASTPYLSPHQDDLQRWKQRTETQASGKMKVGLAWAGNPRRHLDRMRSIPMTTLAPLAEIPSIHFFSLQKTTGAESSADPPAGMCFTDWTSELFDFADTAALVSQLDLVLTVDTAAAHLAGALGKPVWILLPFGSEWRWLTDRHDSPWYPTARLFRQPRPGDWSTVIQNIRDAMLSISADRH